MTARTFKHPLASRRSVRHVDFNIPTPVDVMIDGEIVSLTMQIARYFAGGAGRVHMKCAWLSGAQRSCCGP